MIVAAIDAGNTRLKWGLHDGSGWCAQGALETAAAAELAPVAAAWPRTARVIASNVAGPTVGAAIAAALGGREVDWLRSAAEACGVTNGYDLPERLGTDRWAALIAARGRVAGDCLVVCAGTATTIDRLDADGNFRGGAILPGFELMRSALARNTAQLPLADGAYRVEPRDTGTAIISGCIDAQVGAIERRFALLEPAGRPICLLTGGAAARLRPYLSIPCELAENLVLDGLVRFVGAR